MDKKQANPVRVVALLGALVLAIALMLVLKPGFYFSKFETDTMHLLQILLRMDSGEVPHKDFMTPIGIWAFLPITSLMKLGLPAGSALMWGQFLVVLALFPAACWLGISRLSTVAGVLFGAVILVLAGAVVHGGYDANVSMAMHYNRWSWALAFVALGLSFLPATRRNALFDGVIIGLVMAALALIKATYFAGFALPVVAGLLVRGNGRALGIAVVTGLAVIVLMTLAYGVGFWAAYISDLREVAASEVRIAPGAGLSGVILSPAYLAGTLLMPVAVWLLRQNREDRWSALLFIMMLPAFFYVTYQNFGNDPLWLIFLGVALVALRPEADKSVLGGSSLRGAMMMTAAAGFALAAPAMLNFAHSPLRHFQSAEAHFEPLFAGQAGREDIWFPTARINHVSIGEPLVLPGKSPARDFGTFAGTKLEACELKAGFVGWIEAIVDDLETQGLAKGPQPYVGDLFFSHWVFSDFEPLKGGTPWYYGGLPGFENAETVLVPVCPVNARVRRQILDLISARDDVSLSLLREHPLYRYYKIER